MSERRIMIWRQDFPQNVLAGWYFLPESSLIGSGIRINSGMSGRLQEVAGIILWMLQMARNQRFLICLV